jgi:transglutaminase-like putative cysteine protease
MHYRQMVYIIFFFILRLMSAPHVYGSGDFITVFNTTYTVSDAGLATIDLKVSLINNEANTFAKEYRLTFSSDRINHVTAISNAGSAIPFTVSARDGQTVIDLTFDRPVVGKGKEQSFTIRFDDPDAIQNVGNVLEIMVPRLENSAAVDTYKVTLLVPLQFGNPAIVSPKTYVSSKDPVYTKLAFSGENLKNTGITALFGDRQIYTFSLNYHLQNKTITPLETQIALPPDTPYQKVFYESINPPPASMHSDSDGNWIANYTLDPQKEALVVAKGKIITYLKANPEFPQNSDSLSHYLTEQKYWPVNDPLIKSLASQYSTPMAIYSYLADTFKYDYQRIDNRSTSRVGAKIALEHPDQSLCLEFTDAFITLARSAGIPARLLTGYAYTENSRLRPLSLVQDVLHAWPEYYDFTKNSWQPVDPTWGSTTGGVDYFNSLDFNHLVFAIQGTYPDRPFPAGYYKLDGSTTKDIDITFSKSVPDDTISIKSAFEASPWTYYYLPAVSTVKLTNLSPQAVYNLPLSLSGSNLSLTSPASLPQITLLPYQQTVFPVKFRSIDSSKVPVLKVTINDQTQDYPIYRLPYSTIKTLGFIAASIMLVTISFIVIRFSRRLLVSRQKADRSLHRQSQKSSEAPEIIP